MQNFMKLFVRLCPDVWICVRDGELNGPDGRIQVTVGSQFTRGTNFMGVDLAKMLEEEYARDPPAYLKRA